MTDQQRPDVEPLAVIGPVEPTVGVMVHYDGDAEQHYVIVAGEHETSDGDSGSFRVEIPVSLWARHQTASAEWGRAIAEIVELAEVDAGRKLEPCAEWVGTLPEDRTLPAPWWTVHLNLPGDRPRWLTAWPTEVEAREWAAKMPARFHTLADDRRFVEVDAREHVTVEPEPAPAWPLLVPSCERCGWARDEHPGQDAASGERQ